MELTHAANATAQFEFIITGHQRLVWITLVSIS
jgi:hypothetical protein